MTDEAIPAATLIVVRETASGPPELLMVERSEKMAFAAGALVFPGGRIDAADARISEAAAPVIAAVRETLEETGIPVALDPLPNAEAAAEMQVALAEGADFAELLEARGYSLALDQVTAFARWVPKFHAVRRFDTLFCVAQAPPGDWRPVTIDGECAAGEWLTAAEAIARADRSEIRMIFPTRRNLERLALHDSFEAILNDARSHPIDPVTPWVEERDGERFITIPDHLGYPVTQERLDGLWRG